MTREPDEIRESAKGYREIMGIVPARINGNHQRIARRKNSFRSATKVAERQASESEHQNTRNLLNVDSSLNWPTLLCEPSRFYN